MNILKKIMGAAILAFNIPRIIELTQTLSNGEATSYEMGRLTGAVVMTLLASWLIFSKETAKKA